MSKGQKVIELWQELESIIGGKSLIEELRSMPMSELDLKLQSDDLKQILTRIPEYLRLKNMARFEKMRQFKEIKRKLKETDGFIMLSLDNNEYKNKEMREAALYTNEAHMAQAERMDKLEVELEGLQEEYWIYKTLESNLKSLADLKVQELRSLG